MFSNNYFTPTSRRNIFAQRAREEEARRRAVMEERFYYREQQEQARRAAAAEAMRREEARRRAVEQRQEQLRRQELEQRRRQEEATRQRRVQHYEEEPQYGIVRGRDGYLYRVRLHQEEDAINGLEQRTASKHRNHVDAREEMRGTRKSATVTKAPPQDDNTEATHVRGNVEKPRGTPLSKKDLLRKNAAKKDSNVVVEDASDSESEESELKSVWRNRRPSPEESWMEPVAAV